MITSDHLDSQLIDEKVGPSNVLVYEKNGRQYLFSANREVSEVAVYAIDTEG